MTTTDSSPRPIWADLTLEAFGYSKVALILTGSAVTQVMPFWIEWAVSAAPETEFKVIMRDSAQRFITRHSIESRLKSRVQADSWGGKSSLLRTSIWQSGRTSSWSIRQPWTIHRAWLMASLIRRRCWQQ